MQELVSKATTVSALAEYAKEECDHKGKDQLMSDLIFVQKVLTRSSSSFKNIVNLLNTARENGTTIPKLDAKVNIPVDVARAITDKLGTSENTPKQPNTFDEFEYHQVHCPETKEYCVIVNASKYVIKKGKSFTPAMALSWLRLNYELHDIFELENEAIYMLDHKKNVYLTHYSVNASRYNEFQASLATNSKK